VLTEESVLLATCFYRNVEKAKAVSVMYPNTNFFFCWLSFQQFSWLEVISDFWKFSVHYYFQFHNILWVTRFRKYPCSGLREAMKQPKGKLDGERKGHQK